MKSGLTFLVAARKGEMAELEQLARSSELVGVIGRFTHALQRERGISNVVVASQGRRFRAQRLEQIAECESIEQEVRTQFDLLDTDAVGVRNAARLFSRIAVTLQALEGLGDLRHRVASLETSPRECTATYTALISALLGVVFESADSATDPEISRALVAMFNFMQGKEFAGQERAYGAAVFASGRIDAPSRQEWRHLIESQAACFRVFHDFSDAGVLAADHASQDALVLAELERLRRTGSAPATGEGVDRSLSEAWYECCTHRIDAMKTVEELLAVNLRELCERKIERARSDLRDHQAIVDSLPHQVGATGASGAPQYGPQLERAILGMVQEQSQRLQAMSDELDRVRASLNERKIVERAKGLLMAHHKLTEEDAYKAMRQMAMNQNRKMADVAEAVLAMAEVLPGRS